MRPFETHHKQAFGVIDADTREIVATSIRAEDLMNIILFFIKFGGYELLYITF